MHASSATIAPLTTPADAATPSPPLPASTTSLSSTTMGRNYLTAATAECDYPRAWKLRMTLWRW